MFKRWAALALVLALCALAMPSANAQGQTKGATGALRQNYPNPFNPETTIPFSIGDLLCTDATTQHVVTLVIYNQLGREIAFPKLQTPISGGVGSSGAVGQSLKNAKLSCGQYSGYWDGYLQNTRTKAPSGFYDARLVVDGKVVADLHMTVTK